MLIILTIWIAASVLFAFAHHRMRVRARREEPRRMLLAETLEAAPVRTVLVQRGDFCVWSRRSY